MLTPRTFIFFLLIPLVVITIGVSPWMGSIHLDWDVVWRPGASDMASIVFWQIRVPRMLLSMLAGAGLALGGLVFQALFRNALATPFTLGVAGGASLGAALVISFGLNLSLFGISGVTIAAFLGALFSIGLVYGLARATGRLSPNTMLLGGVAISFFFSSIILLLQYMGDPGNSFRIIHWLMGDLSQAGADSVLRLFPFVLTGALATCLLTRELNLLSIDDDLAASRGVSVERARILLFLAVSLMVAGIVTVCGPIGFVGIIAPHICRLMIGANHRYLIPASILFGGFLLTVCDTLARTLVSGAEVPVGIITSIIGGPFFLWLLFKKARSSPSMG